MSQTNDELLHGKEIFMHEKAELEKFKGDLEKKNADINIFMADFNDKNENFEIKMQTFVNAEAMMKSTMMALTLCLIFFFFILCSYAIKLCNSNIQKDNKILVLQFSSINIICLGESLLCHNLVKVVHG